MNRHAVLYMQAPFVILFLLFIIIPVALLVLGVVLVNAGAPKEAA